MGWLRNGAEHTRQQALRLVWNGRNWLDARRLLKAETQLGELGWQQADFPPHVQETIDTINRIENQQGYLFNDSSEVASQIAAEQQERDARRAEYDAARKIVAEITPQQAAVAAVEAERDDQRTLTAALRDHIPDLEKSERQHRHALDLLMRNSPTPLPAEDFASERIRLTDLLNASISSLSAAHEGMEAAIGKIRAQDEQIAARMPGLEAAQNQLQALDGAFNTADSERAEKLRALQQRKADIERQLSSLDHDKSGYFLIVGRCLADSEIPPMNQPDALQRVLDLRSAVVQRTGAITSSRAWSASLPQGHLRKFYPALGIAFIVLLLALRLLAK